MNRIEWHEKQIMEKKSRINQEEYMLPGRSIKMPNAARDRLQLDAVFESKTLDHRVRGDLVILNFFNITNIIPMSVSLLAIYFDNTKRDKISNDDCNAIDYLVSMLEFLVDISPDILHGKIFLVISQKIFRNIKKCIFPMRY